MESRDLSLHGGSLKLHCVLWGDDAKPAIMMLHGLRAYGNWFDEFADVAKRDFYLVAPDQRGRADSDWAKDGRYDTDSYVADMLEIADSLGLSRFALIGHSMGGTNATNFAALYPERVSALVIVDSAPELDSAGLQRIARETAEMPRSFASIGDARDYLRKLHRRASGPNLETRLRSTVAERDGSYVWRLDPAIFPLKPDSASRSWDALAAIKCPTLVVRAGESDLVTGECANRMVAALRNGEGAEVPKAAHMVLEDNPEGFSEVALPFLLKHLNAA
jgi:esterase